MAGEIKVLRYFIYDGIPSMRDSQITDLYNRMVSDGTIEIMSYNCEPPGPDAFLDLFKRRSISFVAYRNDEPVGIARVDNLQGRYGQGHFCLFKNGWGAGSVEIGKAMLDEALNISDESGPIVDGLLGFLPSSNTAAIDFVYRCGAEKLGCLPFGWRQHGKPCPITIVYFERR